MVTGQIELKRPTCLRLLLISGALLALASIALAHIPLPVQGMLTAGLLAGIGWALWQRHRPLPSLRVQPDGQIQISMAGGDWRRAEVLPGSFVSPGFSVVRLRTADDVLHRLTLLPDSASTDELRQLRVSLRWAPRTRSDTAFPDAG